MCLGGGTPSVPVMQPVEESTPVIIQQAAPPAVEIPEPTPPPSPSKDVTEVVSQDGLLRVAWRHDEPRAPVVSPRIAR
jgi:hypothetical protein